MECVALYTGHGTHRVQVGLPQLLEVVVGADERRESLHGGESARKILRNSVIRGTALLDPYGHGTARHGATRTRPF